MSKAQSPRLRKWPAQLSGQSFPNLHHMPDLDSRDADLQSPPSPSKTSPALFPFSRLAFLSPPGQALVILYDSTPALPSLLQDATFCYPYQGPLWTWRFWQSQVTSVLKKKISQSIDHLIDEKWEGLLPVWVSSVALGWRRPDYLTQVWPSALAVTVHRHPRKMPSPFSTCTGYSTSYPAPGFLNDTWHSSMQNPQQSAPDAIWQQSVCLSPVPACLSEGRNQVLCVFEAQHFLDYPVDQTF